MRRRPARKSKEFGLGEMEPGMRPLNDPLTDKRTADNGYVKIKVIGLGSVVPIKWPAMLAGIHFTGIG